MRYKVRKKHVGWIGKNKEIKRFDYFVYDTKLKKRVSGLFFFRAFAEDEANDLNLEIKFGK